MATRNTLRRSLLYVPGSSPRFLEKSRSLSADCITYDLEDSVTPHKKEEARSLIRRELDQPQPAGIRERAVRINSVDSGLALGDLTEVLKSPNLSTVVVPKVNSAADLSFVGDVVGHVRSEYARRQQQQQEQQQQQQQQQPGTGTGTGTGTGAGPPISILALVESAKSLTNLTQICAASPYLQGLIFAAEDFALDLSITRTPSLTEFLFARSAIVTAARAAELPSTIDLVCTAYRSSGGGGGGGGLGVLEEECRGGKQLGFNGKQCIHPSQVEMVDRVFGPEEGEVEWAVRVVVADEKAAASGRGAWTLEGKMIDVPVAQKARAIVRWAGECGFDVEVLREKWKGQEPE